MNGMDKASRIKVLVVDDAAMVRKILALELSRDPALEVVGTASDAFVAREMIAKLLPDVLILDIQMPQMDGLTFLAHLMESYPMPVIVLSSLAREGGEVALRALELGAAEVIAKPGPAYSVREMCDQLAEKIKAVAQLRQYRQFLAAPAGPVLKAPEKRSDKIIAIGAATGGPQAVAAIISRLPREMPPILVVQHMPPYLTEAFAAELNRLSQLEVKEAEHQEVLAPGRVLIAPGNKHLALVKSGGQYMVTVKDGPVIYHQRPSIEVLFRSVAMYAGPSSIGVILSGRGKDGAHGLLDMKSAGGYTIAQDEASSAVYGMAREAMELGAVSEEVPLDEIAQAILRHL